MTLRSLQKREGASPLIDEVDHFRGDQKPEDDVSVEVIKVP